MWNGVAILFSNERDSTAWYIFLAARILVFLSAILIVLLFRRADTLFFQRQKTLSQELIGFSMMSIAVFVGFAFYMRISGSKPIIFDAVGRRVAIAPFVQHSFNLGSIDQVKDANNGCKQLLIDARYPQDFALGSYSNAVNIPVNTTMWSMMEMFRDISRETPVTVFCQSRSCNFDETVAENFSLLGFQSITVGEEGWVEFMEKRQSGIRNERTPKSSEGQPELEEHDL
jgi:hypothetical protein